MLTLDVLVLSCVFNNLAYVGGLLTALTVWLLLFHEDISAPRSRFYFREYSVITADIGTTD